MAYKFFDKKYLVMPDERDIIGKKVFYADHFDVLVCDVESGDLNKAGKLDDIFTGSSFPFYINNSHWNLAYHDPNYECKVAYSQGKQIQCRNIDGTWEKWTDTLEPEWCIDCEYRVKPEWYVHPFINKDGNCIGHPFYKDKSNKTFVSFEGTEAECDKWIEEHTPKTRRMTNRELARWLADNKGQYAFSCASVFYTSYSYCGGEDAAEVADTVRIRAWDENEWHEPLVEVNE